LLLRVGDLEKKKKFLVQRDGSSHLPQTVALTKEIGVGRGNYGGGG